MYCSHRNAENTEIVLLTQKIRGVIAHTEITEITEMVLLTQKARGVITHTEIMENTEIVSTMQKARKGQEGDGCCDSSDS